MVEKSMYGVDEVPDCAPVKAMRADQVDSVGVEKTTKGFHDDEYTPGTLAEEYDSGAWNNQWDDSFPIDRFPRPTSGNRGGGHPGSR